MASACRNCSHSLKWEAEINGCGWNHRKNWNGSCQMKKNHGLCGCKKPEPK